MAAPGPQNHKQLKLYMSSHFGAAVALIWSPGECAEGAEGVELGEAPAVFVVPELLAGTDEEIGCLRFRPF